jgi:hypothetical protein
MIRENGQGDEVTFLPKHKGRGYFFSVSQTQPVPCRMGIVPQPPDRCSSPLKEARSVRK